MKDYVCNECGKDTITMDATGYWDVDKQKFVAISLAPHTFCTNCDKVVKRKEIGSKKFCAISILMGNYEECNSLCGGVYEVHLLNCLVYVKTMGNCSTLIDELENLNIKIGVFSNIDVKAVMNMITNVQQL